MPVAVFASLSTQWQMSFSGAVGLRYETLGFLLEHVHQVPRADWPEVTSCVQVMEQEWLSIIRARQARQG